MWLLRQPLGLLLLLLLLRCRQFLTDKWRVVYASIHMSLQDTTSFEVSIADRTGSNVCCDGCRRNSGCCRRSTGTARNAIIASCALAFARRLLHLAVL